MSKEKWIEEILKSAKSVQPLDADPWLASKVEAHLQTMDKSMNSKMPLRWAYAAAAFVLVLLTMNILIWRTSINTKNTNSMQQLIHQYGFFQNDIYSANYSN